MKNFMEARNIGLEAEVGAKQLGMAGDLYNQEHFVVPGQIRISLFKRSSRGRGPITPHQPLVVLGIYEVGMRAVTELRETFISQHRIGCSISVLPLL